MAHCVRYLQTCCRHIFLKMNARRLRSDTFVGACLHACVHAVQAAYVDSARLGEELEARVRWAADILLQLTPACSFVALSDGGHVLARWRVCRYCITLLYAVVLWVATLSNLPVERSIT